jgi:hypothetical protein
MNPVNRIEEHYKPDGSLIPAEQAKAAAAAKELQALGTPVSEAPSQTVPTAELHKAVSVSAEVFLQEFKAALQANNVYAFDASKYTPQEQALLAKFQTIMDSKDAVIDLNLSDKPDEAEVLAKVQSGLGQIPNEYKALISETVIKALKDNPKARDAFQDLVRYAKASSAVLAEAKQANLTEADIVKLKNLLRQAQPFQGVFGVLVANTFDAAKKLDVKALLEIFKDYSAGLENILKPLATKHLPKDVPLDPLEIAGKAQPGIQTMIAEYAQQAAPIAQQTMQKSLEYMQREAGPLSKILASGLAALRVAVDSFNPAPSKIGALLEQLSKQQGSKAELN